MIERIKELIEKLNIWRKEYYIDSNPSVSDAEYDKEYDELVKLEIETGIVFPNSPTQTVGFPVQSEFKKVIHNHPMLSLDKVKTAEEIYEFSNDKDLVVMDKCDGLTVSLTYNNKGYFVKGETRGDGEIGEDITENIKQVSNVPMKIEVTKETIIDGEIIVKQDVFEIMNAKIEDEEDKFSHPRNYASGSIRQLNTAITKERQLSFIAWKYIKGDFEDTEYSNNFIARLNYMKQLGFEVVPFTGYSNLTGNIKEEVNNINTILEAFKKQAKVENIPIDGVVWGYNDVFYGESLGMTEHHLRSQIAYKYPNNGVKTILRKVEWNVGKTGKVNPKAIFDTINLDGAEVTKATLHNVSIMKSLKIGIGDEIVVAKMNEIIPNVIENNTCSNTYKYPTKCPCCGDTLVHIIDEKSKVETLWCKNKACPQKNLAKFKQFVSKQGMNIDGLSEKKIEVLINAGYITNFASIYHLNKHPEIADMEGWGKKSYQKMLDAIEKSRTVKLNNFLVALSIPNVGKTVAKTINKAFKGNYKNFMDALFDGYDFSVFDDIGETINQSLYDWYNDSNAKELEKFLYAELTFDTSDFDNVKTVEALPVPTEASEDYDASFCLGKTFVVTGKFNHYKREEISEIIEKRGGKLAGSVSSKCNFLLTNDGKSGSSKAKKAKELNIPIMTEEEFLNKVGLL